MTTAEILYQLQEIDVTLKQHTDRVNQVKEEIGENEAYRQARNALEQAQMGLQDSQKEQRRLELELQSINDKLSAEESRLYSGNVKNPKELAGLQKEVRYLRTSRSQVEDSLLETMVTSEESSDQVHAKQSAYDSVAQTWEQGQAHLLEEKSELESNLEALSVRRSEVTSALSPKILSEYDYLRRTKMTAVAEVQKDMCLGCRVSMSAIDRQKVQSEELVNCSNCGRILVHLA